ncbi:hypothetical protein BD626DRAFT_253059 [Schizophyllum amplum]|uniref:Uncharacterized protein n=1 Tax=Schizophyllum amplum TaxID=97359 RepID=A0A550CI45_9AGAR|nr:hypothetical protein BD626DRAFT_253059 [Auriculariopsis ampla]
MKTSYSARYSACIRHYSVSSYHLVPAELAVNDQLLTFVFDNDPIQWLVPVLNRRHVPMPLTDDSTAWFVLPSTPPLLPAPPLLNITISSSVYGFMREDGGRHLSLRGQDRITLAEKTMSWQVEGRPEARLKDRKTTLTTSETASRSRQGRAALAPSLHFDCGKECTALTAKREGLYMPMTASSDKTFSNANV